MTTADSTDIDYGARKGGAGFWILAPLIVLLFAGGALSVAAYIYAEPQLTVVEAIGAGFGGLGGIIIGLIAAAFGIIVGLFGAVLGLATAGGAVALTLFIIGSPIIAIILLVLLMRRRRTDCPDPTAH